MKQSGQDTTRFPILQGVLPITVARIPAEIIAGITLAAIAIPEAMGYTKIAGTPVITGLYTMLIPTALFALFGSSRHLVVDADSATKRASGTPVATGISNQPLVAAAPQPARNQKNQPRGASALTKDQACSPPAEAHRRAGLADDEQPTHKRTVELAACICEPAVVLPTQVWPSMPNGPLLSVGDDGWSFCPNNGQPV